MSDVQNIRRFRANPIEVGIFSVVSLILFHSLYTLFYDDKAFYHAHIAQSMSVDTGSRAPASDSTALLNVNIQCVAAAKVEKTDANGIKITGPLCGSDQEESGRQLMEATIINNTNHFSATVFSGNDSAHFSTDYIPLVLGNNILRIDFKYRGGAKFNQQLTVTKN